MIIRVFIFTALFLLSSSLEIYAQASRSALLPADVVARVMSIPPARAAKFCQKPASLKHYLGKRPPSRVLGYNSRMDNGASVEGARALENMTRDISRVAAYAFIARDARTKSEMLDVLSHWARSGAFTATKSCTRNGKFLKGCTEWTRPDGRDLSSMKDFSTVQMAISSMQRGYYLGAADFQVKERASDHAAIQAWFEIFNKRMKNPNSVYFGLQMGWYWPEIDERAAKGGPGKARGTAKKMGSGLERLMLRDGSMKDRTTRGDRALWYHNSAINETVHSMELMRATGVKVPVAMEDKLHRAVNLFARSVSDYSVIDPWARKAHNARYKPNFQDWSRNWQNNSWGGSWWHIYPYRYPDRPESRWLEATVSDRAGSAFADEEIGVGLGCTYNAAKATR